MIYENLYKVKRSLVYEDQFPKSRKARKESQAEALQDVFENADNSSLLGDWSMGTC